MASLGGRIRRISLVVALLATSIVAAPAAAQDLVLCDGREATLVGTEGNDRLVGTEGRDVIVGLGGHDRIFGLGGNDVICGGTGRDRMSGGLGNDRIFGQTGQDFLRGGSGRDTLVGGPAFDRLIGGSGADEIKGNAGNDLVRAGGGADEINGGNGDDTLEGGDGDDIIRGWYGDDSIDGQDGEDVCVDTIDTLKRQCLDVGKFEPVVLARANWSQGYVQAEIVRSVVEELGYDINDPHEGHEYSPDLAYLLMADGAIDFWANSWYPSHTMWWEGERADGSVIGDHLRRMPTSIMPNSPQGFLVTKAWADEYGFTTIDEINADPALAAMLPDVDGNGRPEIFTCPQDWTCDDIAESMFAFAGWDNLQPRKAGYDAMWFDFLQRVDEGQPAVMYTWTPSAYLHSAEIGTKTMWISMEESSVLDESNPLRLDGGAEYSQRAGGEIGNSQPARQCLVGPDGCQLGWNGWDINITANSTFLDTQPGLVRLFGDVRVDAVELSALQVEQNAGNGSHAHVQELAERWVNDNRALVDSWLIAATEASDAKEPSNTTGLVEVPHVANLTVSAAVTAIANSGFRFVTDEERADPDVERGLVLHTIPPAGSLQEAGERITIIVSSGVSTATVPPLDGLRAGSAIQQLVAMRFVPVVEYELTSDPAEINRVLAQSPPALTDAYVGSIVRIIVGRETVG